MSNNIDSLISLLNRKIEQLEYGNNPPELYRPIDYIMNLGGKRIRPLLALLAYQLYKDDFDGIIEPVIALELFHNFTLMHDDIMDKAPLRRGKQTVHEKWNGNIAILSGDVMMIKVYDLLLLIEPELLAKGIRRFNDCAVKVCEGQQLDMNFETCDIIDENQYMDMIDKKTGALLGFSLEFGAFLAGASDKDCQSLREFGEYIGLGFQLTDDLLDAYSNEEKFGKKIGGDIIADKKTYLLVKALEMAEDLVASKLNFYLGSKDLDPNEKIQSILEIYDGLNIKAITEQKIKECFDKGFEAFKKVDVAAERKSDIIRLAQSLIYREK